MAINISKFVKKNVFGTMVDRMDAREDEVSAIPGAFHCGGRFAKAVPYHERGDGQGRTQHAPH